MDQSAIVRAEKEQQKLARLVDLLMDWAEWMGRDKGVEGYAARSAVLSGAGLKLFDDMCRQVDGAVNRIIDACINDLSPAEHAAIHHRYLDAVFRVPRVHYDYPTVLKNAHENLMRKVEKKGVLLGD